MIKVWLNHWFSTAYCIVRLLKKGNPDVYVVGSHKDQHSSIEIVCDEWHREPDMTGDEYVAFCLEFCIKHSIDAFIPRRELVSISRHRSDFEAIGTKVMVDNYELMSSLNDKADAYKMLASLDVGHIPEYRVADSTKSFIDAYEELSNSFEQICVKFATDVGGKSFRLIDNSIDSFKALFKKSSTRISYSDYLHALEGHVSFPKLMLMPYLPDEEVSIDCLKTDIGTIAISRIKTNSRIERVEHSGLLIDECREILQKVPLENPCNIQYKYLDGKPYLLEINTRMSGGIHMSCAASGINIPLVALNELLMLDTTWRLVMRSHYVTQAEIPITIDRQEM